MSNEAIFLPHCEPPAACNPKGYQPAYKNIGGLAPFRALGRALALNYALHINYGKNK